MISSRNSARVRLNPIGTAALFVAVVILLLPSVARAQQVATPKRILVLYWYDQRLRREYRFRTELPSSSAVSPAWNR